jgi:hypothetical protein
MKIPKRWYEIAWTPLLSDKNSLFMARGNIGNAFGRIPFGTGCFIG